MRQDLALTAEILAVILLLASMGAFLLYVPALAQAVVVINLLGLILMFVLGFQAGRGAIKIWRVRKPRPSELAPWSPNA